MRPEPRKCQENMIRYEKGLNAFKDRLRTDEEEITRLGSSARTALLNLGREATPEEVVAVIEENETKIESLMEKSQCSEREIRREFAKPEAGYENADNEMKENEKSGELTSSTRLEEIRVEFNEA